MTLHAPKLPKNEDTLARIIEDHAVRERYRLGYWRMMMLLGFHYLAGVRQFTVLNEHSGQVTPGSAINVDDGKLEYQAQDLLSAVNRNAMYLSGYDVSPKVFYTGTSLHRRRDRAVTQVLMDQWVSSDQLFEKKIEFCHIMTGLGLCGITGHMVEHPTVGLSADLEVVHPMELIPFPSLGYDYTRQTGLMREQIVPMSYLKKKFNISKQKKEKMEYWEVKHGSVPETSNTGDYTASGTVGPSLRRRPAKSSDQSETVEEKARIREVWFYGPRSTCIRYVVQSGEAILQDLDFSDTVAYPAVGVGRFMENGTFHGTGIFSLLYPIARQIEMNVKQLFQNTRDIDRYGIVVMPQGDMQMNSALRDIGKGLKVLPWDPDPLHQGFRPFSIQPFNSGDVPGKTAAFGNEIFDRLNPLQDLIAEKGRVDSAVGLAYLDEQISQSMSGPSAGVRKAFSECWRSVADRGVGLAVQSDAPVRVSSLSLDLAGVVLEQDRDEVTFHDNRVPDIYSLTFGVSEAAPRSQVARKQEALQLYEQQLSDPDALRLFAIEEGIDLATYMKEYEGSYYNIVRAILVLYGDGENPGQWVMTPTTSKASFQLRVLDAFLQGPAMTVASPEVHDEFSRFREWLLYQMGQVLPEGIPNPDDLVAMREVESQLAGSLEGM